MIRHVIWDWNGTLLDDVEHALIALNSLLDERAMTRVDRSAYREQFGFPVQDFYVQLGFDFSRERFVQVSELFIERYKAAARTATVHARAHATLTALQAHGVQQSVLSAMEINLLSSMLSEHGLTGYLQHVRGLDHLHATSKVALGVELMRHILESSRVTPSETLFVGDTIHDHETAAAMGCHCLLYVDGHQTPERLRVTGSRVIHSLDEVVSFVVGHGAV
jgi:phosphoglycolate phosphatase